MRITVLCQCLESECTLPVAGRRCCGKLGHVSAEGVVTLKGRAAGCIQHRRRAAQCGACLLNGVFGGLYTLHCSSLYAGRCPERVHAPSR